MLSHSLKTGLSFGFTSGIITTLGLMVGLHSGTHSKLAVLGGILTIAIADAFSDALGIHISEESEIKHTTREIWQSTIATFFAKFFFALTFAIPVLLFTLKTAVLVAIIWGFLILGVMNFFLAREEKIAPWKVIGEHFLVAIIVITISHFLGDSLTTLFP